LGQLQVVLLAPARILAQLQLAGELRAYLARRSWDGAGAGENLLHRPAAARTIGR
jgi:hypothetical protein